MPEMQSFLGEDTHTPLLSLQNTYVLGWWNRDERGASEAERIWVGQEINLIVFAVSNANLLYIVIVYTRDSR